ncbi:hypothetical protein E4T52_01549 [Aureobasidium sp. EXF-3400]|nr:hypothetical protein E4T51_06932 [Aureobasidium sp. EXF-12344]KAI4783541.1 hypothetical protein E4T52_01549 [Aureobasidium sp. EXF-3400]
MPHSKTPGGSGISDKEAKRRAESTFRFPTPRAFGVIHGESKAPGEAPVASDSGATNVGIDNGSNQPGEKGIKGVPVSTESTTNANMK